MVAAPLPNPPAVIVAPLPGTSAALDHPIETVTAAQIRGWTRAAGHDVPDRGCLSADIIVAYHKAHQPYP